MPHAQPRIQRIPSLAAMVLGIPLVVGLSAGGSRAIASPRLDARFLESFVTWQEEPPPGEEPTQETPPSPAVEEEPRAQEAPEAAPASQPAGAPGQDAGKGGQEAGPPGQDLNASGSEKPPVEPGSDAAAVLPDASREEPFLMVLGIAQDGGIPQAGCRREGICARAWHDPAFRRRVACLGIATGGKTYLIDATPDLPAQAAELEPYRLDPPPRVPVDGIFLTHGHIGHYLGLAFLGREATGAAAVPVWGTDRMRLLLRDNAPWEQLVKLKNIELRPVRDEKAVELPGGVRVEALDVPHRDEYTDTLAFRIQGPSKAVLYLPDIDGWEAWDQDLVEVLHGVDRAYLDGTFFSADELPGRNLEEIPHPAVAETIARLHDLPPEERAKVRFVHLNHTNPLLDPASPASQQLREAGMAVAEEGEWMSLR